MCRTNYVKPEGGLADLGSWKITRDLHMDRWCKIAWLPQLGIKRVGRRHIAAWRSPQMGGRAHVAGHNLHSGVAFFTLGLEPSVFAHAHRFEVGNLGGQEGESVVV